MIWSVCLRIGCVHVHVCARTHTRAEKEGGPWSNHLVIDEFMKKSTNSSIRASFLIGRIVPAGCLDDGRLPSHPMGLSLWDSYRVPGLLPTYDTPLNAFPNSANSGTTP